MRSARTIGQFLDNDMYLVRLKHGQWLDKTCALAPCDTPSPDMGLRMLGKHVALTDLFFISPLLICYPRLKCPVHPLIPCALPPPFMSLPNDTAPHSRAPSLMWYNLWPRMTSSEIGTSNPWQSSFTLNCCAQKVLRKLNATTQSQKFNVISFILTVCVASLSNCLGTQRRQSIWIWQRNIRSEYTEAKLVWIASYSTWQYIFCLKYLPSRGERLNHPCSNIYYFFVPSTSENFKRKALCRTKISPLALCQLWDAHWTETWTLSGRNICIHIHQQPNAIQRMHSERTLLGTAAWRCVKAPSIRSCLPYRCQDASSKCVFGFLHGLIVTQLIKIMWHRLRGSFTLKVMWGWGWRKLQILGRRQTRPPGFLHAPWGTHVCSW